MSQDAAKDIPHGKRAAYAMIRILKFPIDGQLTRVPALNTPPRAPLGPSLVLTFGIPLAGIATVLHASAPLINETFNCQYEGKYKSHSSATYLLYER